MATYRMMPPPSGNTEVVTLYGRKYSCAAGSTIDVPDFDALVLRSNNWTIVGVVGPTTARPAVLPPGIPAYVDTTLNKIVVHDGKTFRDHTGSSV